MTTGYGCNFCDEPRPVAWLITALSNGETLAVCAEDFPVALIPLLAGELGVDPNRFYDAVKRFTDREAAKEAKTTASTKGKDHCPPVPGATCFDPIQCAELGHCLKFNDDGTISHEFPEQVPS